ncbi:MAG: Lrp/AsnC family transcriptional regulator [Candidatus Omnitrophota bacterium]|nr:MAG: Lrp/AsnC family transcriptional regulator [Candidatus Omnitrophota bacterium]HDM08773.1 Lrp/AsnC family transcriptional regulator [Candidatus Omnitrophota bacterium]
MKEIIELLEKNARLTPEDISRILKKDIATVKKTIEKLEKSGVILGYKAIINEEKSKSFKPVRAVIEVQVTPKRNQGFDYIAERIYKFPEVVTCFLVSGTYDLLLIVEGDNIHDVAQFVAEKLAPLEGVRGTVTHFLLKKYKQDGFVLTKGKENHRQSISL